MNKKIRNALADSEIETLTRAEAAIAAGKESFKAETLALNGQFMAKIEALVAEQHAHLDRRWDELIAASDRMFDQAGGIGAAAVAEVIARVFAELPPDVVPVVRAAMERAAGHVSTGGLVDLQTMMHGLGRPN